jgi:hypothetical protein
MVVPLNQKIHTVDFSPPLARYEVLDMHPHIVAVPCTILPRFKKIRNSSCSKRAIPLCARAADWATLRDISADVIARSRSHRGMGSVHQSAIMARKRSRAAQQLRHQPQGQLPYWEHIPQPFKPCTNGFQTVWTPRHNKRKRKRFKPCTNVCTRERLELYLQASHFETLQCLSVYFPL